MADIQKTFSYAEFVSEQHKAYAYAVLLGAMADKHLEHVLKPFDISVNKYRILRGLKKTYPEGMGVYKLKEFLVIGDADISRLVSGLVKKGLTSRKRDKANKSMMQVTLTDEGLALINDIHTHLSEFIEPFMCFTEEESMQLNKLMSKAIDSFTRIGHKSA